MSDKTGIEWTDATWNPTRGCTRVSEGCRHCYAEGIAYRFSGPGQPYEGLVTLDADGRRKRQWNGQIRFVEEALLQPLRWRRPRRIFVNSMSDLFHEGVTDAQLDRIFAVMALCPQHTFQVLTKRPERMLTYFDLHTDNRTDEISGHAIQISDGGHMGCLELPLPNVWLGVSVENQAAADERIPLLLETPATVRFLSAEPLLGKVRLGREILTTGSEACAECGCISAWQDYMTASLGCTNPECTSSSEALALGRLDWVIVGGESGRAARPMHPDWARSLRDQCAAAGVPFFFKQHGEWIAMNEFAWRAGEKNDQELPISCFRIGKKAAGDLLDGERHHAFPEARMPGRFISLT